MEKINALQNHSTIGENGELTDTAVEQAQEIARYYDKINGYVLSEKDFYPPEDKRVFRSGVNDIPNGDNFDDYCEYLYETYGEDLFDESII